MRDILLLCFYFWAITPSLAIAAEGATDGKYSSIAVTALVLLFLYLLWKRRRRKKLKNVSSSNAQIEVCSSYTTKNCPGCGERIPLDCAQCEYCEKKQKNGDTTCSGGVESSARARSHFLSERQKATRVGSKGYIWRTAQDGAVCERCAANNGKEFSWDKEPEGGHAGATARCRCYPEPLIPGHPPRPNSLSRWEKEQQSIELQRKKEAQAYADDIRGLLGDDIQPERLVLRKFWGKWYLVFDNVPRKPIIAFDFCDMEKKRVIFFSKPEEDIDHGSRRVTIGSVEDIMKYKKRLKDTLFKYL